MIHPVHVQQRLVKPDIDMFSRQQNATEVIVIRDLAFLRLALDV